MNFTKAQLKRWSNNFAGLLLVSVLMAVVAVLANRASPSEATALLMWFLGTLAFVSLVGWTWTAHKLADQVADKTLFKPF